MPSGLFLFIQAKKKRIRIAIELYLLMRLIVNE